MRALSIFIFVLFTKFCFCQQNFVAGKYENDFGETLILKPDSTFKYIWKFDLASSWNIGTWKINDKNEIKLFKKEIFDTIKDNDKIELVLSTSEFSQTTTSKKFALNSISGGGQSRKLIPENLIFKNGKIFTFSSSGKIQNKKISTSLNSKQKSKPWFEKIINKGTKGNSLKLLGKIVGEITPTGSCGYIAFATVIEFEILESNIDNYTLKKIPIIIKCPDFFKENYFNKTDTYELTLSNDKEADFRYTITNYVLLKEYNLPMQYWMKSIEKL